MDSSDLKQPVRQLITEGKGEFFEKDYLVPMLLVDEIRVRSIMTGICRSDIDMMTGDFTLLPTSMHGHEGLGQVIAVGNNIDDCNIGDYVATRGEPAYADVYNCKQGTYCIVPEADPKYIIEPVACAVNMELVCHEELKQRDGGNMLIIGTGFLARVFHQTISQSSDYSFNVDVLGNSNMDYWESSADNVMNDYTKYDYDVVVNLKETEQIYDILTKPNTLIIMGTIPNPDGVNSSANWLWNNVTVKMPSPRAETFHNAMKLATKMVSQDKIKLDNVWTNNYNRETNWKQGFEDALNRPGNYSRGYIKWA
jgi:threonine dehydrogenase-like Zn-dependent dehydrogenase